MRLSSLALRSVLLLSLCASLAFAQSGAKLPQELQQSIDNVARQVLASTGVPSASIAIVRDNQIAYLQAYGDARLDPRTPARPEMRYSIGSISKQFTAASVLLLQEEGKLSLDDPVGKFVPSSPDAGSTSSSRLMSSSRTITDGACRSRGGG